MEKHNLLLPLFFFMLLGFTVPVYAGDNEVDFSKIPEALADKLNISTFAGQIIATGLILLTFDMLILVMAKAGRGGERNSFLAILIVDFVILTACVAMGWLHYWILILITLIVALGYAVLFKNLMTGGKN